MKRTGKIDITKLLKYMLKKSWFIVLCTALGFGLFYLISTRYYPDTFTASGTLYVSNGDYASSEESDENTPKQYVSAGDLEAGVGLLYSYETIIKSDRMMNKVLEIIEPKHSGITKKNLSNWILLESVEKTGVIIIRVVSDDAQLSADIVNAVLDVTDTEIVRIVGGDSEIIDYATVGALPDDKNEIKRGVLGGLAGAVLSVAVLFFLFLLNNQITDVNDLTDNYTPPVLGSVHASNKAAMYKNKGVLSEQTSPESLEDYALLQVQLLYALEDKKGNSVVITSASEEEGKSVLAANLAVSCALNGIRVLLVDGNLRENRQEKLFKLDHQTSGLADILETGEVSQNSIVKNITNGMDLIPAGQFHGTPAGLLRTANMQHFLEKMAAEYDLVLLDMPAVNTAVDSLVVSKFVAGSLFTVLQNISDHREIRKALISAEMSGMDVLGFVYCGDNLVKV